jgi:cysteine desulfurase
MDTLPADMLSMSAHKLHGPKGIGALYIRNGVKIEPLIHGGGQERGLRSATEHVAGIVGFGKAADLSRVEMDAESVRLANFRDRIIAGIEEKIPNAYLIGHPRKRLPGHICLGVAGREADAVLIMLLLNEDGISISTGSACSTPSAGKPSYILLAMGMDSTQARGSLRITLGRFTTELEVETFIQALPRAIGNLNPLSVQELAVV